VEDAPAPPEDVTTYTIHKLTYSDGRAYRYHIYDEAENLRYVAERTGMQLPSPTRLVEFFDPEENPSGRLQPPDIAPWLRGTRYEIFAGEEAEEPYAVVQERWGLVDILLLRLPRYDVRFGKHRYVVRGSRYGAHFYDIYRPHQDEQDEEEGQEPEVAEEPEAPAVEDLEDIDLDLELEDQTDDEERAKPKDTRVGEIHRPAAGPSYIIKTQAAPLRQALLVLAALAILIDMEQYS
jgi:hypothetical protein